MSTYQSRREAERVNREVAANACNSAHVSPAGIATVRDASGVFRAAKLNEAQLRELEEECRVALRRYA
jgi:hypothetical protein